MTRLVGKSKDPKIYNYDDLLPLVTLEEKKSKWYLTDYPGVTPDRGQLLDLWVYVTSPKSKKSVASFIGTVFTVSLRKGKSLTFLCVDVNDNFRKIDVLISKLDVANLEGTLAELVTSEKDSKTVSVSLCWSL